MPRFVNRGPQLAALATQQERLGAGHGATVVVCGHPGLGSSALLRHWVEHQAAHRVLEAHGVESESDLPFAGLAGLLAPILDLVDELPAPQPAALRGALALGPVTGADRFTVFVAVVGLLAQAAKAQPLVVAVDDVHHLDPSSRAALAFASRRLADDPVLIVLAGRTDALADGSFDHATVIELEPLGPDDARTLLVETAGAPIHPAVLPRLVEAASGNPGALVALATILSPDQLSGRRPLDDPLPVGVELERGVARRAADLPVATRRAILLLAVGADEGADVVDAALRAADLGRDDVVAAERAGLVELAAGRFGFRDGRMRAAVYHASSPADRREAHRGIAAALDPGSPARAAHAAAAAIGPDEAVAADLEAVAIEADQRGDAAAAWHAWERSAALSTDVEDRGRRLLGAAAAALRVGSPDAADRLLHEAEPLVASEQRGTRELLLGRLLVVTGRPDAAVAAFTARADELEADEPGHAAALLLEAVPAMVRTGRIGVALALARRSADLAAGAGDPALDARAAVALGAALTAAGDVGPGRELLDRYRDVAELEGAAAAAPFLADTAALALVRLGDHDRARALLDQLAHAVGEASAPHSAPSVLAVQGFLEYRAGRLDDAAAASAAAVQIADETRQPGLVAFPLATLATVQAMRGDEAACRAAAERLAALGAHQEGGRGRDIVARAAVGLLELGLGRPDAAVAVLEPLRSTLDQSRPSVVMWEADLADALIRAGRPDDATPVIATLEDAAQRADDRRARAAALRLRALAAPDDDDRAALHDDAVAAYRELGLTFGVGRSLLDQGAWLRRARRRKAARVPLQEASSRFEAMGAAPWARLAGSELERCGGATRQADDGTSPLTAQERQVATLIADGASNREAAARLFVSVRTIESHLSRIYRKVGVRSRSELTGWVARTDLDA